jgi:hypothetical protein
LIYEYLHLRVFRGFLQQHSISFRPVLSLFLVLLGFRDIRDCLETDMK